MRQVETLKQKRLLRFRAAGKFAYAYADSFGELGPGNRAYWLASAFDKIWLQPLGTVGLTGSAMSLPFAKDLLDKVGIKADMRQRHEYKGAAEMFTQTTLPAPLRENYTRLLNDLHTTMLADIGTARGIEQKTLRQLVDQAPLLDREALDARLIDALGYADEARSAASRAAREGQEDSEWTEAPEMNVFSYLFAKPQTDPEPKASVALIYVEGAITRLAGERGPMGEDQAVSAQELVEAITQAAGDEEIKAILLRINSPGGSVAASESIHRALELAKANGKYVVVSMGEIAASGGYWIATAADTVFASPSTITGSIGVVGGKIVFGELARKLGITMAELGTGANSDMFSPVKPFSPAASARINASLDSIYAAFAARVATARNLSPAQIDKVARGRVWTGASAKEAGLVDELGGLREAFTAIKTHLGYTADDRLSVRMLPESESPFKRVLIILQHLLSSAAPFSLSQLNSWLQLPALNSMGALVYTGPQVE